MAEVSGFEPENARIKTLCLTAWLYPIKIYSFPPILRIHSLHFRNYCGDQPTVSIVVSQPLTAACDLGLQAVVS